MSDLITKLNKIASTKEAIRQAINNMKGSEVVTTLVEFDEYPGYIFTPSARLQYKLIA